MKNISINSLKLVPKDLATRLSLAMRCAEEAGNIVLSKISGSFETRSKGLNDVVTAVDIEVERFIVACLSQEFPRDGFYGEESGIKTSHESGRWIIDPIDGTDDFIHRIPNFTISIAFQDEVGELCVGVVYNPSQRELYCAAKGMGAFLNGSPISVSRISAPGKAMVITAPPLRIHERAPWYFALMQRIFLQTWDERNFGSAALHLAYIASGRADAFYEIGLKPYDIAAGFVILREAGGSWSGFEDGEDPLATGRVLATNGALHEWFKDQIKAIPEF